MKKNQNEPIRLNKFISHNSQYSRREADTIIQEGNVKVNGKVVSNLATKVTPEDKVQIGKMNIKEDKEKLITVIIYNKPKGEIVSKNDPRGRRTIFESISSKFKHFMPIGRLDFASEGLLLLTDSVDVLNALTNSDLQRVYKLKLDGEITHQVEDAMQKGLELDDATKGGHVKSDIKQMSFKPFIGYDILKNDSKFSKIKVAISEGKNRELRRFFGYFDLNVLDLKRFEFGGITLNNLPTGKTRYLTKDEYRDLRYFLNHKDD
ncbi:MAG: pseudouridine synthase [Campylobacterota bacterium]